MKWYRQGKPINVNFLSHFSRHVEQCVSTSRGKRPTEQRIQPLLQCHSKDPLRQKSSITLLSIQYGIYTLHDSLCCSSAAVNMGNLTSILQVHRSAKVQYSTKWTWPAKKSRILHCTARLQNVALPVSNSNLKVLYKCYDRAFFWHNYVHI